MSLQMKMHSIMEGYFDLYLDDPTTGNHREFLGVRNLLTNTGLDDFGAASHAFDFICVGNGTNSPSNSDTKLQSLVAISFGAKSQVAGASPPYWKGFQLTTQFGQGVAAGNIAEVGVCDSNNTSTYILRSRARIVDSEGNPTIITVLPTEFLTVIYTLRIYQSVVDVTGSVSGYSFVLRPSAITSTSPGLVNNAGFNSSIYSGCAVTASSIVAITNTPSSLSTAKRFDSGTYVSGSYTLTRTAAFALGDGNLGAGGIKSINWYFVSGVSWQAQFTPNILKDNTKLLDITCVQTWGRA